MLRAFPVFMMAIPLWIFLHFLFGGEFMQDGKFIFIDENYLSSFVPPILLLSILFYSNVDKRKYILLFNYFVIILLIGLFSWIKIHPTELTFRENILYFNKNNSEKIIPINEIDFVQLRKFMGKVNYTDVIISTSSGIYETSFNNKFYKENDFEYFLESLSRNYIHYIWKK